jgi:hypothetical protein
MAATKAGQSKLPRIHTASSGLIFSWTELVTADTLCENVSRNDLGIRDRASAVLELLYRGGQGQVDPILAYPREQSGRSKGLKEMNSTALPACGARPSGRAIHAPRCAATT